MIKHKHSRTISKRESQTLDKATARECGIIPNNPFSKPADHQLHHQSKLQSSPLLCFSRLVILGATTEKNRQVLSLSLHRVAIF